MRKLDALYFIILGFLTLAMLVMLALWVKTVKILYLCLMIGVFAVYSFFIIFTLLRDSRDLRATGPFRSRYLMLLCHMDSKIVYITFLGNEKRALKPSPLRKDYLVEFYEPQTDLEKLRNHIWFDLSEADEKELNRSCIGGMDVPYPFLADIRDRKVLIQNGFYQLVKDLPHFSDFLTKNEIIPYGD